MASRARHSRAAAARRCRKEVEEEEENQSIMKCSVDPDTVIKVAMESSDREKTYELPDGNITTGGASSKPPRCPVISTHDTDLQSRMKCSVDLNTGMKLNLVGKEASSTYDDALLVMKAAVERLAREKTYESPGRNIVTECSVQSAHSSCQKVLSQPSPVGSEASSTRDSNLQYIMNYSVDIDTEMKTAMGDLGKEEKKTYESPDGNIITADCEPCVSSSCPETLPQQSLGEEDPNEEKVYDFDLFGAEAEAMEVEFHKGALILFCGLKSAQSLNGRRGLIQGFDEERSRFIVLSAGRMEPILVKRDNIMRHP